LRSEKGNLILHQKKGKVNYSPPRAPLKPAFMFWGQRRDIEGVAQGLAKGKEGRASWGSRRGIEGVAQGLAQGKEGRASWGSRRDIEGVAQGVAKGKEGRASWGVACAQATPCTPPLRALGVKVVLLSCSSSTEALPLYHYAKPIGQKRRITRHSGTLIIERMS
jgi:hypothetical protein